MGIGYEGSFDMSSLAQASDLVQELFGRLVLVETFLAKK